MKGFIEVTQREETKILVAVKEIKFIENFEEGAIIVLDLNVSKKSLVRGYKFVTESYEEIKAKIEAAI